MRSHDMLSGEREGNLTETAADRKSLNRKNKHLTMKIIIIDDTQQAIDALKGKLADYPCAEVTGTANNGTEGLKLLRKEKADVVFLDVEMPDMTGLQLLTQMKHEGFGNILAVIYTAYGSYTLPALRSKAFDFLLKPIDDNELRAVMARLEAETDCTETQQADRQQHNTADEQTERQNGNVLSRKDDKLLLYTNASDFRLVEIQDICAFQYNRDLRIWEVVAANCEQPIRLKRCANKDILMALDERFVQVNQKYIINIRYLMEVRDNVCYFFPPFNRIDYIKIGRMYRRQLISKFNTI